MDRESHTTGVAIAEGSSRGFGMRSTSRFGGGTSIESRMMKSVAEPSASAIDGGEVTDELAGEAARGSGDDE